MRVKRRREVSAPVNDRRSPLLPLLGVLMDVFWAYPWLAWAGQLPAFGWSKAPLGLVSAVAIAAAACFTTRALVARRMAMARVRLCVAASGLVLMLIILRVEYPGGASLFDAAWFTYMGGLLAGSITRFEALMVALAAGAVLWWRGITWGRSEAGFQDVYRRFRAGLMSTVLLVVAWGVSLGNASAVFYVAGFFFCGLSALALANLEAVRRDLRYHGEGARAGFSRRWLYILFGLAGGMVVFGMLAAGLFSFDVAASVGRFLGTAADVVLQGLYYLLIPIGYIVAGLVYAGRFIVSLLRREPPPPTEEFEPPDWSKLTQSEEGAGGLPPALALALKWAVFLLIAGAVVYLLVRAIRRLRPAGDSEDIEEMDESLWSWPGFMQDLRQVLAAILGWFRPRLRKITDASYADRSEAEGDEDLDVREAYRRLLRESLRQGLGRRGQETALEYAGRLGKKVPEGREGLDELTGIYVDVRYGETPAAAPSVARANGLWRSLRSRLRGLPPSPRS